MNAMDLVTRLRQIQRFIDPPEHSYWLTRYLFLRGLGGIYAIAFWVLCQQAVPLIGENGILPAPFYLEQQAQAVAQDWQAWLNSPSVFWLWCGDVALLIGAYLGLIFALLLMVGFNSAGLLLVLWLLYTSFVNIGQLFYGFGWEILLLETGFLAIFLVPWRRLDQDPPPKAVIWLIRWLLFRVMFGAGLIKLRGDPCWLDLSCLIYHYETQPLPHLLSWYWHHLPAWVHKLSVLSTHVVELIVPWMLFGPRRVRLWGGVLTAGFQLMLILSGNLSWFNWLTLVLCLACFDDLALRHWVPIKMNIASVSQRTRGRRWVLGGLTVLIMYLSIAPVRNLLSTRQLMNTSFDRLHLVNTYGAFGSVGKQRFELSVEGTHAAVPDEKAIWLPYEFKAKPGNVYKRPSFVAPYHYRLDWQIWFAAMSDYRQHPWLISFIYRLLQHEPSVLRLMGHNPFADIPPTYIRVERYEYRFSAFDRPDKEWWQRHRVGAYLPPLHLDNPKLKSFLQAYIGLAK